MFFTFFFAFCIGSAQTETPAKTVKEIKVQRLTFMEQFEPDMVEPKEESLQRKKDQYALMAQQRQVIDTLDISDRKKKRLIEMIYKSPYSDRLAKVMDPDPEDGKP